MASIPISEQQQQQQQEKESIIPVLTVFKNKSIIKNIFIILNNNDDDDHTLLVGRHPNNNIILTHPSISRFHLQIQFTPSSRSISLLDSSSVHGTWVSGKKLEHGVSVDLKEGDTFQLGVSSRIYLLHFVSQFDADSLKNIGQFGLQKIGSLCYDNEMKDQSQDETFEVENDSFGSETSCDSENKLDDGCEICFLSPPYVQSVDEAVNTQIIETYSEVEMPAGETNLLCTLKECFKQNICIPVVEAVQGTKFPQESSVEKQWIDPAVSSDEKGDAFVDVMPKESECEDTFEDSDKVEDISITEARVFNSEDMADSETHLTNTDDEVSVDSLSDGHKQDSCGQEYELELQKCIENIDHVASGENGVAAVNVTPTEHEFGCNFEENDKIDDILTSVAILFISEKISSLVEETMSETSFQQIKIDEEVDVDVTPTEHEFGCNFEENDRIDDILTSVARLFISEKISSLVEETMFETNFQQIKIVEEVAVDSLSDGDKQNKLDKELQTYLNAKPCDEEGNSPDGVVEDTMKTFQTESPNPSVAMEADLDITDDKENWTPQSLVAESCKERSTKRCSNFGSDIRSRRDKAASAPPNQTRKGRLLNTPNVDSTFELSNLKDINIIHKPMPRDLFSVLDEEEMFTTPNKEHLQFMKNKSNLEDSKSSKSHRSHNLKVNFSPNIIYSTERSTSAISNKENLTPKEAHIWKSGRKSLEYRNATELRKKRMERIPLQSLVSSGGNCSSRNSTSFSSPFSAAKSVVGVTARASNFRHVSDKHCEPSVRISKERKRSWDMVVDTSSLLNKGSRKALQLLQGLKGTRLIIPQSVIKELGNMKQQIGILRRISEAALALEWIKECIGNTKWWIHILDCDFPMVEDQILECALKYRRNDNVGQIVLLSEDVTLKIKSMAKGLLCETVHQFRQSLVNPFSERFMWNNSSPRGLTWSCRDEVVLREKYCCLPPKAGLKLLAT